MRWAKVPSASATCMASSRVGVRTSAWTPRWVGSTAASSGSPNAAVLPVPVWATPVMSRPASSAGMACSWIAVGVVKPSVAAARSSVAGSAMSLKRGPSVSTASSFRIDSEMGSRAASSTAGFTDNQSLVGRSIGRPGGRFRSLPSKVS